MMLFGGRLMMHIAIVLLFPLCHGEEGSGEANVLFTNTYEDPITMFWKDGQDGDNLVEVGGVNPYDTIGIGSFIGHSFVSKNDNTGVSKTVIVQEETTSFVFGPTDLLVECSTTEGDFQAHIKPEWSPYGATRFLHLVKSGYFDGCALNRVVKNFLTQFGISADFEKRTMYRSMKIPDDKPRFKTAFQPGFLSYAGSGPGSRSTEVFVVMPGTPQSQLNHFGTNPWETPFGYVVQEDLEKVISKWYSYGDMSPWGNGPDPQKIYQEDGYDVYLKEEFPMMSYIKKCRIAIPEEGEL